MNFMTMFVLTENEKKIKPFLSCWQNLNETINSFCVSKKNHLFNSFNFLGAVFLHSELILCGS